jgi:nitrogen fixation protein FixH
VNTRAALVLLVLSTGLVAASCTASHDAAPAAAAQTVSTPQMTVTFASEPGPLTTGDNKILVTVKQPDGTPIADGNVTAVFSMPAMPSMNMPAMRSDATLTPQGNGVYRGTGQLSMAGTWSVALSVSRSGQPLGTAQFSVVAK